MQAAHFLIGLVKQLAVVALLPEAAEYEFEERQVAGFIANVVQNPLGQARLKGEAHVRRRLGDGPLQFGPGHGAKIDLGVLQLFGKATLLPPFIASPGCSISSTRRYKTVPRIINLLLSYLLPCHGKIHSDVKPGTDSRSETTRPREHARGEMEPKGGVCPDASHYDSFSVGARDPLATHRATGIAGDSGALPRPAQGIEPQETAFERLSGAGQELHDLHWLHTADDPDERRHDAVSAQRSGRSAISG